ncbi:fibronectin type III domain-containing protein [Corynebacterium sp. H130]|uniref:fibronectin type III domain-containing protein n=1 Tax=Corynebacterium sp. H130 TaxID=3133444 RepID=UPI0030A1443F
MRASQKHLAALVAALSTLSPLTPALAQDIAPAQNIVLGVGSDETQANVVWLTDTQSTGQKVQFAKASEVTADTLTTHGITVDATSTVANIATGMTRQEVREKNAATSKDMGRHAATMTGLEANTEYIYRVGSEETGWSEVKTFTTEDFDRDWNFLFLGDPQLGTGFSTAESEAMWKDALAKITTDSPNASFIQSAGDQTNLGNLDEHTGLTAAGEMQSIPFAPLNGNHDNYDFESYQAFYNRPNVTQDGRNYFYEYNNVLVVSLDSNHVFDDLDADAQFVQDTIAAHGGDKDWTIVTFHHPPYSQAWHQIDDNIKYMRAHLVPKLNEMGVDLVLSGHDHIYTRSHMIKDGQPVIPEKKAAPGDVYVQGDKETMFITANSATGTKFYDFYSPEGDYPGITREDADKWGLTQPYTAYWDQQYSPNYTDIQVSANELKVVVKDVATMGEVDSFTLVKNQPSVVEPPADGSSSSFGALAGLLALIAGIGGTVWAALNSLLHIPGIDIRAELKKFGL